MMRFACCALLLLVGQIAAQPAMVTYRVTLRSFLPAHCIRKSEYVDVWQFPAYQGADDTLYDLSSLAGIDGTDARFKLDGGNGVSYSASMAGNIDAEIYCPYWNHMRNGTIRAHPDFESAAESKVSGASNCYLGGQPRPSCLGLQSVIKFELETASSGLDKVVYCVDDGNGRCGQNLSNLRYTTSRGRFYKSWFNDDPVYNKRVGDTITLEFQTSGVGAGTFYLEDDNFFPLSKFSSGVSEATHPDPDLLPVWPNWLSQIVPRHYGFTTELHTYFQYNGGETFRFNGDDDVYVWINGRLAVDLGGTHGPVNQAISLDTYAGATFLNLTVGEVYSFDMFHAERHWQQSTFHLSTTLSTACNVFVSGSLVFQQALATAADLKLGRGAFFDATTGAVQLTTAGRTLPYSSTFAYLLQQQNVGAGFIAEFDFSTSGANGIEGFAFVMHARPEGLVNLPKSTGANLGFRYLTRGLAVVFDMCADRMTNPGACKQQSVRLHFPNSTDAFNGPSNDTLQVYDGVMRSLHVDNEVHTVRIEYLQRPAWFEVYIDNSLYLRQVDFSVLDVLGGRNAFVGFTTATGASVGALNVTGLNITAVEVDASQTLSVDLNETAPAKEILGDGEDAAGFSILTRDFCENVLDYGGYKSMMKAYYVPLPVVRQLRGGRALQASANESGIIEADIRDNQDGTYTALLRSTEVTSYALYACFGVGCDFNLTDMTLIGAGWNGSVANAMSVRALTSAPSTSPTVSAPTQGADTGSAVLASSIGGGSALFALLAVGLILFVLRRRWQRDRAFIEDGALYNMEREVTYDKNDEYSTIGKMVMNTTAAIQRERAQKAGGATGADALAAENEELQEQVRINKQKQQEAKQAAAARSVFNRGAKKAVKKKEFQADLGSPNL